MLGVKYHGPLQQPSRRGNVAVFEGLQAVVVEVVGLLPVLLPARLGFANLQFSAPPLLFPGVRRQCSFPLVFSTMGVPRKPKCLRI
jgi:hypothetical protein